MREGVQCHACLETEVLLLIQRTIGRRKFWVFPVTLGPVSNRQFRRVHDDPSLLPGGEQKVLKLVVTMEVLVRLTTI